MISPVVTEREEGSRGEEGPVILFREGLVGCASWRRFVLKEDPEGGPIKLLQCLDEPEVGLLIVDPCLIVADYEVDLSETDARQLELEESSEANIYCTLTVHQNPVRVTANLLGPLVVNTKAALGKQLVLASSNYSVHHPVALAEDAEQGGQPVRQ